MPIKYKKPKGWDTIIRPRILARAQNKCERCGAENGRIHPLTGSIVSLQVSHLDHNHENNLDENLQAACQKCHTAYDEKLHVRNRANTRTKKGTFLKSYKNVGKKEGSAQGGTSTDTRCSSLRKNKKLGKKATNQKDGFYGGTSTAEDVSTLRKKRVTKSQGGTSRKLGVFRVILREPEISLEELNHKVEIRKKEGKMPLEQKLMLHPYHEPKYERWYHFFSSKGNDGIRIADMQEQKHDDFLVSQAGRFRVMRETDGTETLESREHSTDFVPPNDL